jgi:hypothetical protein
MSMNATSAYASAGDPEIRATRLAERHGKLNLGAPNYHLGSEHNDPQRSSRGVTHPHGTFGARDHSLHFVASKLPQMWPPSMPFSGEPG